MNVLIWIEATRPKTLIATISPVLIGSAIAMSDGFFDLLVFFLTFFTAVCMQICSNLVNDYYDGIKGSDTPRRAGPLRLTSSNRVPAAKVKRTCILCFFFTFLLGSCLIWRGGWVIELLLGLSLLLAYGYSAGPFPLAYLGLGELVAFFFYGPIAVAGTYFLQAERFSAQAFLAGIAPGALACSILIMNNLRDREEDAQANKKTLAVRFGRFFGKCEYLFCLLIAILMPFLFFAQKPFLIVSSLIAIPILFYLPALFFAKEAQHFVPLFFKTIQLFFLYTFLFLFSWMI
jgi:1,4-dihydroxy-2-naphthoate polyprenyltransferase